MYYTAGIWLIYAGVILRVLVRYAGLPQQDLIVLLMALFGLLLFVEPFVTRRSASGQLESVWDQPRDKARTLRWFAATYLFMQTVLVVAMFCVPPHTDFFAGLFIPLSLQAVLFFGRRLGFLYIAVLPVVMFITLTANEKGWPFALTMSFFAGGLCFLFGSYAGQIQEAERAHSQNQRMLDELQVANRQLATYALQLEDLAAEQERSRLARELHDSVTQTVFSMNLTVQSARLLLDSDRSRAAGQLARLEELAASAMSEIQTLVSQLRPSSASPMEAEGLPAALRRLAVDRRLQDGLEMTLEVHGERPLARVTEAGLYRIVQEALTNVARHAGTCEVSIHLSLSSDPAWLDIEDHGLGFDLEAALRQRGHLGLPGMAERAREIGWSLSIDSRPGHGTRIRLEESPVEGR